MFNQEEQIMKRLLTLILTTFILLTACKRTPFNESPFVNTFDPDFFGTVSFSAELDDFIDSVMTQDNIPGLGLAIIRGGEVAWTQGYGYADFELEDSTLVNQNTIFQTGELSRAVTATALMQLYEQGMFNLDDDINDFLSFEIRNPSFTSNPISFRMLLGHTSSLKDNPTVINPLVTIGGDADVSLTDFVQGYFEAGGTYYDPTNNFYANIPGMVYQDQDVNYAVAGYMVEAITGISLDQYCKTHVFPKLGIYDASWFLSTFNTTNPYDLAQPHNAFLGQYDPYGVPWYPNSQLRIGVEHMSRYLFAIMNGGRYNQQTMLNDTTVTAMQQILDATADPNQAAGWKYRSFNGRTLLGQMDDGVGLTNRMYADTSTGVGVVLLTNGEGYSAGLDAIMEKVFSVSE